MCESELLFLLGTVCLLNLFGTLTGERHTKRQCLRALFDISAELLRLRKSGERTRLDAALDALVQSQKLVSQTVVMEAGVSLVNEPRLLILMRFQIETNYPRPSGEAS